MSKTSSHLIEINSLLPNYKYIVTDNILSLSDKKLLFTIKVKGLDFASLSDEEVESCFKTFINVFNEIGKTYGNNLGIWTHLIKSIDNFVDYKTFKNSFITKMAERYYKGFSENTFYKIDYFITFVLNYTEFEKGLQDCKDLILRINKTLVEYVPYPLGIVIRKDTAYSETLEFLAFLFTSEHIEVPLLTNVSFSEYLGKLANIHFGYDTCETRANNTTNSTFSMFYDLNSFPADTYLSM